MGIPYMGVGWLALKQLQQTHILKQMQITNIHPTEEMSSCTRTSSPSERLC